MTEAPGGHRSKLTRRGTLAVVAGAVALLIAIVVIASSGSDDSSSAGRTTAPTSTEATTTTAPGIITTVAGNVTQIVDAGHFVVNDGQTDYTIVTSAATKLVDVNGAPMTADSISVAGLVQVTGTVKDKTIEADRIVLPAASTPATGPSVSSSEPSESSVSSESSETSQP